MSARIIPFPITRRQDFVARQARRAAEINDSERYLLQQIRIQREALERKGVDPAIIENEMASLERALRAAFKDTKKPGAA